MKDTVKKLSEKYSVAIVSGRMREDVEKLAGIPDIFYAGSHGFDIKGPGFSMVQPEADKARPVISGIIENLSEKLSDIQGILIEKKQFSVAVHYRLVEEKYLQGISNVVDEIMKAHTGLCLMSGKKVYEILPDIDWDKGKAIRWIMDALKIAWNEASVVYVGDDVTDEYAFRTIRTRGTGVLVSDGPRVSAADFQLASTDEVRKLFAKIIEIS